MNTHKTNKEKMISLTFSYMQILNIFVERYITRIKNSIQRKKIYS